MSHIIVHPTSPIHWSIESSFLAQVPLGITSGSLGELRGKIQRFADDSSSRVPFGKLEFRYEATDTGEVVVVHAYFVARNLTKKRFMRLRSEKYCVIAA